MNNILVRSLSGAVYISLLIVAVLFKAHLAVLIFGVITGIALFEYSKLFSHKGYELDSKVVLFSGLSIYLIFGLSSLKLISGFWLGAIPILLLIPLLNALYDASEKALLCESTYFDSLFIPS